MTESDREGLVARFRRVLNYVDAHLEDDLSVERLSGVAAYSKHHFHRQFSALFGVGVHELVQLVRFKRAAYDLAFRERAVIDVALDARYESPEAFARAFKKTTGQTSTWGRSPTRLGRRDAVRSALFATSGGRT